MSASPAESLSPKLLVVSMLSLSSCLGTFAEQFSSNPTFTSVPSTDAGFFIWPDFVNFSSLLRTDSKSCSRLFQHVTASAM
uniref:Putative secreted protein n=1 Tax=Ixodes ricinus TaxID=34613 RepID=A0A6B0TW72_IXORI